jgi:hypothetical protein
MGGDTQAAAVCGTLILFLLLLLCVLRHFII